MFFLVIFCNSYHYPLRRTFVPSEFCSTELLNLEVSDTTDGELCSKARFIIPLFSNCNFQIVTPFSDFLPGLQWLL
jgi:hypothetical protein